MAFDELDWASVATEIAQLGDERSRLESASDMLKQLNHDLRALQQLLGGRRCRLY